MELSTVNKVESKNNCKEQPINKQLEHLYFTIKSLKLSPAALPIIMLGGSPISVAVPPTLDAKICVIKNGTGLSPSISVTAIVIGPTKSTVVTLSRKAERTAVIMKK